MLYQEKLLTFGPVPSRRLGQSLGINNIPPKICTYSCVYCQVGRTLNMQINREEFYTVNEIVQSVEKHIKAAQKRGEHIDYLTFVPDGEPTLDCNIGKEIELLKPLGINIAVITNATLLWREDVRSGVSQADWVSVKVDAVSSDIWRKVDRPHRTLQLDKILEGISKFSNSFSGELVTETMLINDINDKTGEFKKIAHFISELKPFKSYLSIPTRPPAEKRVNSASELSITMAYQIFRDHGMDTEYLIGYEGNAFAFTGNVEEDILSIASVHPIREEGVNELLTKAHADWSQIKKLIHEDKLIEVDYQGKKFYMRKLADSRRNQ